MWYIQSPALPLAQVAKSKDDKIAKLEKELQAKTMTHFITSSLRDWGGGSVRNASRKGV